MLATMDTYLPHRFGGVVRTFIVRWGFCFIGEMYAVVT